MLRVFSLIWQILGMSSLGMLMVASGLANVIPGSGTPDRIKLKSSNEKTVVQNSYQEIVRDLKGESAEAGLKKLREKGIEYRIRNSVTCKANEGDKVIGITPDDVDSDFDLVVTIGVPGAIISDLFGELVDQAETSLKSQGFRNLQSSGNGLFVTGLSVGYEKCISLDTDITILTEAASIKPEGTPDCEDHQKAQAIYRLNTSDIEVTEFDLSGSISPPRTYSKTLRSAPGFSLARLIRPHKSPYFYALFLQNHPTSKDLFIRVYCNSDFSEISEHQARADGISYGFIEVPGDTFLLQTDGSQFLKWNIETNRWKSFYTPQPIIGFSVKLGEENQRIVYLSRSGDLMSQDLDMEGMWKTLVSIKEPMERPTAVSHFGNAIMLLSPNRGYSYVENMDRLVNLYGGKKQIYVSSNSFSPIDSFSQGFLYITKANHPKGLKHATAIHLRRRLENQTSTKIDQVDVSGLFSSKDFINAKFYVFPQSNKLVDLSVLIAQNKEKGSQLRCLSLTKSIAGRKWVVSDTGKEKLFDEKLILSLIQILDRNGEYYLLYANGEIKLKYRASDIC